MNLFKLLNVACFKNVVNMTFSYCIIVYCVKKSKSFDPIWAT